MHLIWTSGITPCFVLLVWWSSRLLILLLYKENIFFSRRFHRFQNIRKSGEEPRESLLSPQKTERTLVKFYTVGLLNSWVLRTRTAHFIVSVAASYTDGSILKESGYQRPNLCLVLYNAQRQSTCWSKTKGFVTARYRDCTYSVIKLLHKVDS